MTKDELLYRISDIEWDDFEVKEAKSELPKNVWETVSAFANTSGGWIVLGVKQMGKKFEISGVDNAEKLEQDFFATLRSNQKFNAVINSFAKLYQFDDKKVIAFHIESSPDKPIYFNNPQNTFIRMGSGDQRATNAEIDAMFRNKSYGVKSEQSIPEGVNICSLNTESLRSYRTYMRNFDYLPELQVIDDLEFCKKLGICKPDGTLTYAGLLMFGKYETVRQYVPTFWMDLLEIPGRSFAEAATRYTYRIPEQDNLWEYYMVMIKRLRLIAETPFKMNSEGFNVEDDRQFKVLREALVNMLMHTDHFSTIHSCIRIFTDRVEFFNAGAMPFPISDIGKQYYSNPRNPSIAKFFRYIHLSETAGYGIDLMRGWKELTGNDVTFYSDVTTSSVTFELLNNTIHEFVKDEENHKNDKEQFVKEFVKEEKFTKEFVKASHQIIEMIAQNPHSSASQMSETLNITARQVQKYLKRLQELQKITRQGGRKQGEWIILDKDFINFLDMI